MERHSKQEEKKTPKPLRPDRALKKKRLEDALRANLKRRKTAKKV